MTTMKKEKQNLAIKVVRDWEGFLKLEDDWDRLIQAQSFKTIFQSFAFHKIWWESFGDGHDLHILTVSDSEIIVVIVPFMLSGKSLEFIGAPNFDYHDFIGHNNREIIAAVIDYLAGNNVEWDTVSLNQVSERTSSCNLLREILGKSQLSWLIRESDHCLVYEYDGKQDEREKFTVRKGRNYKKAVNHFNRMGGSEIRRVVDQNEAKQLLEQIFHLHIMRWKGTETPSKFEKTVHREFYRRLLKYLSIEDNLHMVVQTVAKVPVAISLSFLMDTTTFNYTLSYSEFFRKRSPGNFFVTAQSEQLVREGYTLDFARGSQEYKQALSSGEHINFEICIYSSSLNLFIHKLYERLKKTSSITRLRNNRKLQQTRSRFNHTRSKFGLLQGIYSLFGHVRKVTPDIAPTIFKRIDGLQNHKSPDNDVSYVEIDQKESLALAVLTGVIDESPQYDKLDKQFSDGDRFFIARRGYVPVAACRVTKFDYSTDLSNNISEAQAVLCDLFVSDIVQNKHVLSGLIAFAATETDTNYLVAIGPSQGQNMSIQSAGFKSVD